MGMMKVQASKKLAPSQPFLIPFLFFSISYAGAFLRKITHHLPLWPYLPFSAFFGLFRPFTALCKAKKSTVKLPMCLGHGMALKLQEMVQTWWNCFSIRIT